MSAQFGGQLAVNALGFAAQIKISELVANATHVVFQIAQLGTAAFDGGAGTDAGFRQGGYFVSSPANQADGYSQEKGLQVSFHA